ncbi:alpha/beta fold hydrolase [Pseudomarimonas arenosa]|uniref:Alpha/beta hydrolase n=1 Tax=Pseudomarimonas arenosa TaxID=2774145 RepID=A0AAW3ZFQ0_9GAMM|nr:alpha/beta hydrolase [Pseudomarimonas arenosa]MBD8524970.1 alpha/beta hydrolase [Pseudomarimonas arenosa]
MAHTATTARARHLPRPDGVRLAFDHWPNPGPGVLFAHGFGQTRGAWCATATRLAAIGYDVRALDARGHGDSDWLPEGGQYAMQQFIEDLEASAAELRSPWLVGASMGGLLGIAAQSRTRCFAGLILVDIAPRWDARGVARILDFMEAFPDGFASLNHAADAIAGYLPHRERKTEQALRAVLRQDSSGRWRWHWDPRMLNAIGRAGEQHQHALIEAARQIEVPVLLISGGRSDLIGEAEVAHFLELVPHAQHRRIEQATHMVAGDQNDAFTDAIVEFLPPVTATVTVSNGALS